MIHQKLTQERVRELFNYDPETGELSWKARRQKVTVGMEVGCVDNTTGYRMATICGKKRSVHRLIWLYVYGYSSENQIDHINRNRSDNRLCNLLEVSAYCNMRNIGNRKDNASGVKGVSFEKSSKKWIVKISVNGMRYTIGRYKDFDNAVCSRLAAEQCFGWSGCELYSPAFKYVSQRIQGNNL